MTRPGNTRSAGFWERFYYLLGPALRSPQVQALNFSLPLVGGILLTFVPPLETTPQRVMLGLGLLLIAAAIILQTLVFFAVRRLKLAERGQLTVQIVALRNGLLPLATIVADMQTRPKFERESERLGAARHICNAIQLILRNVPDVRAVCYRVRDETTPGSPRLMDVYAFAGRTNQPPDGFTEADRRGQAAFKVLEGGLPVFVRDVDDPNEIARAGIQYFGSRNNYKTFISVPIVAAGNAFGMLTVDAPQTGDLDEIGEALMSIFAALLATAFASVRPRV